MEVVFFFGVLMSNHPDINNTVDWAVETSVLPSIIADLTVMPSCFQVFVEGFLMLVILFPHGQILVHVNNVVMYMSKLNFLKRFFAVFCLFYDSLPYKRNKKM